MAKHTQIFPTKDVIKLGKNNSYILIIQLIHYYAIEKIMRVNLTFSQHQ